MDEFEEIIERNYTAGELSVLSMKAMTYEDWRDIMENREDNAA